MSKLRSEGRGPTIGGPVVKVWKQGIQPPRIVTANAHNQWPGDQTHFDPPPKGDGQPAFGQIMRAGGSGGSKNSGYPSTSDGG